MRDEDIPSHSERHLRYGRCLLAPGENPGFLARVHDLRKLVSSWRGPGTLVLVAHAMTVRPLVGILREQAETVVLQPAPATELGVRVVGRTPRPD